MVPRSAGGLAGARRPWAGAARAGPCPAEPRSQPTTRCPSWSRCSPRSRPRSPPTPGPGPASGRGPALTPGRHLPSPWQRRQRPQPPTLGGKVLGRSFRPLYGAGGLSRRACRFESRVRRTGPRGTPVPPSGSASVGPSVPRCEVGTAPFCGCREQDKAVGMAAASPRRKGITAGTRARRNYKMQPIYLFTFY